jgi:MoaA/NifB/PqqE/SkfB family radical SAM enzyme
MKIKYNWEYKPNSVEVEMSHHCNILCGGCAIREDVRRALYRFQEEEILDFLKQAKKVGILCYSLTGGEPFLNFDLLKNIIAKSPIDLIKINTNGFIFSSPKKTKIIFQELKDLGFSIRNKKIPVGLNISIGQQNAAGIPLENSVFACREFYNIFSKDKAYISLNVFSLNKDYSMKTMERFIEKYKLITGRNFDFENIKLKLIPADCRYSSTALNLKESKRKKEVKTLIKEYLGGSSIINCFPAEIQKKYEIIAPRILLRADGSVYSCYGFGHVYNLGNIKEEKLKSMLKKASENISLKTVFKSGLSGLLKLAERYQKDIGNKKISISYGPCDICRLLRNVVILNN